MVSRRTLACQYGSLDEFAIIVARQSKPIDTSSPDAVSSPLWHATQRSDVWNGGSGVLPEAKAMAPIVTTNDNASPRNLIAILRGTRHRTSPRAGKTRTASSGLPGSTPESA